MIKKDYIYLGLELSYISSQPFCDDPHRKFGLVMWFVILVKVFIYFFLVFQRDLNDAFQSASGISFCLS